MLSCSLYSNDQLNIACRSNAVNYHQKMISPQGVQPQGGGVDLHFKTGYPNGVKRSMHDSYNVHASANLNRCRTEGVQDTKKSQQGGTNCWFMKWHKSIALSFETRSQEPYDQAPRRLGKRSFQKNECLVLVHIFWFPRKSLESFCARIGEFQRS